MWIDFVLRGRKFGSLLIPLMPATFLKKLSRQIPVLLTLILLSVILCSMFVIQFMLAAEDEAVTIEKCNSTLSAGGSIVYRIHEHEVFEVCLDSTSQVILPESLIVASGVYVFRLNNENGQQLSINIIATEPGLYRIFHPDFGSRQFLVWKPDLGVKTLLSDLSYVYAHGNTDDALSLSELDEESQIRVISVTCGTISRFLQHLLISFNIDSRLIVSVTLEALNQLDDGHIMLEIYERSRWIIVDPDSRTVFGTDNNPLGVNDIMLKFVPKVGENISPFAPLFSVDVGGFEDTIGSDLTFLEEKSRVSYRSLSKWYDRVLGKIGIQKDAYFWFSDLANDEERQRILYFYPEAQFASIEHLTK